MPGIQNQSECDHFINVTGKSVTEVIDEALIYLAETTPAIEEVCILQNQEFTLNLADYDLENDVIVEKQLQYVHDANYFDNPTGQEPGTMMDYDPNLGWTTTVMNKFSNVGKYRILRRVKDLPSGSFGSQYSYYSCTTEVNILVHRRPIADAILDWEYNPATGNCDTIWIDKSYDLDHNVSMENKGIVDRKIMFRRNGGGWQYFIPDTLTYGNYDVQYYVQDVESAWSDPWLYSFTLDGNPQFTAQARAKDALFTLASIPASETIESYNLWTRQPGNIRLEFGLTPTVSGLPAIKTVPYQQGVTGNKSGQDTTWFNQDLQIPDVFPDGPRTFTVYARDTGSGVATPKTFSVNVFTPINLVPGIAGQTLTANQATVLTASTSKYPATTTVIMQYGTAWQSGSVYMAGMISGYAKNWTTNYTIPNAVPDGTYTARFVSTNPSGKQEIRTCTYTVTHNRPPTVLITGTNPTVIYEGDDVTTS